MDLKLLAVAGGQAPADIVVKNGKIGKERVAELSAMVQRVTESSVEIQMEMSVKYADPGTMSRDTT